MKEKNSDISVEFKQNLDILLKAARRENGFFPELRRLPNDIKETFDLNIMKAVLHAQKAITEAMEKHNALNTSQTIVKESGEIFKSIGRFFDEMAKKDPTIMTITKFATLASIAYLIATCYVSVKTAAALCIDIESNIEKFVQNIDKGLEMIGGIKNESIKVLEILQNVYEKHDLASIKELANTLLAVGKKLGDANNVIKNVSAFNLSNVELNTILSDTGPVNKIKAVLTLGAQALGSEFTQGLFIDNIKNKIQEQYEAILETAKDQIQINTLKTFKKNIINNLENFKAEMNSIQYENPIRKLTAIISSSTKLCDSIKNDPNEQSIANVFINTIQRQVLDPAKSFISSLKLLSPDIRKQFGLDRRTEHYLQEGVIMPQQLKL